MEKVVFNEISCRDVLSPKTAKYILSFEQIQFCHLEKYIFHLDKYKGLLQRKWVGSVRAPTLARESPLEVNWMLALENALETALETALEVACLMGF